MQTSAFVPHPLLRGGQLQTFAGQVLASCVLSTPTENLEIALPDGDRLLLHVNHPSINKPSWMTSSHAADQLPVVVLLHGLGGCSGSTYILRITMQLNRLGYTVVRFNHRGCGPGATTIARQIYHAARAADVEATVRALERHFPGRSILATAFSLSANMLLKMLGEGGAKWRDTSLRAAMAVCPPIDLEACSQALASPRNRAIDVYFTRRMRSLAAMRFRAYPDTPRPELPRRLNLRLFDELYTAPHAGFPNRDAYYLHASSKPHLRDIAVPTQILAAADDPIIPAVSFQGTQTSRAVTLRIERSGGHMGFISKDRTPLGDRRWMDCAVVDWVRAATLTHRC